MPTYMERHIKGKGFKKTTILSEALKRWIKASGIKVKAEKIAINEAYNRIVFDNINSPIDIPTHNRSAMDGYGVIAESIYGATPFNPITLKVKGAISINGPVTVSINREEAVEVTTGSPLPKEINAVVKLEEIKRLNDQIQVFQSIRPFENIIQKGEDFYKGKQILQKGERITSYHIGVLKAIGVNTINVAKKPLVAVGTTGSELVENLPDIIGYQIVDSNRPTLISLIKELGGSPIDLGILGDNRIKIIHSIKKSIAKCDIIVLTGGSSVGLKDNTISALENIEGSRLIAHGLSIRPGMPTGLWIIDKKPIAALPGNPVAAMISFLYLVKPMLRHMMNIEYEAERARALKVKALLKQRVASPIGIRSYVRVKLSEEDGEFTVIPVSIHGSSMMSSMIEADGILEIPENSEGHDVNEKVYVTLFKPY